MDICRFIPILGIILFVGYVNADATDGRIAETEKRVEESRIAWNKFLAENCPKDATEQAVRKLMDGKYRDITLVRGSKITYGLLFLIDDFHQVFFGFYDKNSRLTQTPRVEPRGQWLRMPSGYVKSIPSSAEMKLKSKVAEAAIEYVVKHTHHKRDSLFVYCIRSEKAPTWDVEVAFKSLALVSPSGYLLEITNDGVVVKGPFSDNGEREASKKEAEEKASGSKTSPSRDEDD
jgi:hypothetical protein